MAERLDVVDIALVLQIRHAGRDKLRHHLRRPRRIEAFRCQLHRAVAIDAGIGEDEAVGGKLSRMVRDDAVRDTGVQHQIAGVQRAGAAQSPSA